jgi:hypothetical protein
VRRKGKNAGTFKVIWVVQPWFKKYSASRLTHITKRVPFRCLDELRLCRLGIKLTSPPNRRMSAVEGKSGQQSFVA